MALLNRIIVQQIQIIAVSYSGLMAAVSIMTANQHIENTENDLAVLLSLSNEMTKVRTVKDLENAIRLKLKKLFHIKDFTILIINSDKKTWSHFVSCRDDALKDDKKFQDYMSRKYDVNDRLFNTVLQAENFYIFHIDEMKTWEVVPDYIKYWKLLGIEYSVCFPLSNGKENIGVLYFQPEKIELLDTLNYTLLKGVASQISIAVCNIIANEEIGRREQEKTILLSLSNEIAALRNRNDLFEVVNTKIKKLFSISDFGIAQINEDRTTYSAFVLEVTDAIKNHADFKAVTTAKYGITDCVFSKVMKTDEPIIFDVNDITDKPEIPAYIEFWKTIGVSKVICVALRVGGNNIGCLFLHIDVNDIANLNTNLLKGICAQLSVAISNILANENIARRESERELLLSLNIDIAAVRNNNEFLHIINQKLKKLLTFSHTLIAIVDDDKTTVSAFLLDPESRSRTHPDYKDAKIFNYLINDGVIDKALATSVPLIYDLDELNKNKTKELPLYLKVNFESGISQVVVIRFCKAGEAFGLWMIFFDKITALDCSKMSLIEGLANQMSIAVLNIIANQQIQQREEEKSKLLAFSNAMASVRDNTIFAKILKQQLDDLFGIKDYVIHALSDDKKTHRVILYDHEADFAKHPDFQKLIRKQTDVNDGVYNITLAADDLVSFNVEDWFKMKTPPPYANAAKAICLKIMNSIALRLGEENIAIFNFRNNEQNLPAVKKPLFKSICSQLAIAVANIIANEKVVNQLNEINIYKQQLEEEKIYLIEEIETTQNFAEMIGDSKEMKKVFRLVAQVAPSDSTVLLLGETGTGKELIARAIHNASPRKNKLMVKVNCAALPVNLIESELFGHERGSFTGAIERRIGKFELANNGTLFLDEIGEMPLELQVKLLRALQEKEIERVGGKLTIKVDVRIIAATNRDLEKLMEEGKFRNDLFYRLNIFPINLPPLRDRREDIPSLASHFITRFSKKAGRKINTFSNKAIQELIQYHWPGNIRELEHLIERSVLLTTGDIIKEIHLPSLKQNKSTITNCEEVAITTIDNNEMSHILKILKHCKGRIAGEGGAAELLGVPPSTLNSKMKRLGIRKEHFV